MSYHRKRWEGRFLLIELLGLSPPPSSSSLLRLMSQKGDAVTFIISASERESERIKTVQQMKFRSKTHSAPRIDPLPGRKKRPTRRVRCRCFYCNGTVTAIAAVAASAAATAKVYKVNSSRKEDWVFHLDLGVDRQSQNGPNIAVRARESKREHKTFLES